MVTLDQIKELRNLTGVSTMACKLALAETGGDIQKAVEILRKKGEAKTAARSDRSTGEGGFFVKSGQGKVSFVALKCETDFVARTEDFLRFGQELADSEFSGNFASASSRVNEVAAKMGEKLEISEHMTFEGPVASFYIHNNLKIAVVTVLSGGSDEIARDVSMHIAGLAPKYIRPEEVPASDVENEKSIWTEQLKNEGKPEAVIGKILQGKEKKFREEQALLTQSFVKDPEKSVAQYLGGNQVMKFYRGVI